ncbi:hypothetical protein ABBQ38_005212 [Trebouxia sp. C0009 RCD-2024]
MPPKRQCMVVLRHALRLDEVDLAFVGSSKAPWDPPLAPAGFEQARAVSRELQTFEISTIVASPFQRCLETADTILKSWHKSLDTWHVDCKLCEMLTPRNLNLLDRPVPNGHIQDWMWHGVETEQAIQSAVPDGKVIIDDPRLPAFPESAEEAHARINAVLEDIGNRFQGNILVIAHGEV